MTRTELSWYKEKMGRAQLRTATRAQAVMMLTAAALAGSTQLAQMHQAALKMARSKMVGIQALWTTMPLRRGQGKQGTLFLWRPVAEKSILSYL